MKTKRITITDIAEKSGYSKTAVSFAFNCPSRISREACEKILAVAKELDYIPDPMARNFSLGRHMSIGFLMPQIAQACLANPYMQEVIKGIGIICQSHGYNLTIIPPLHSSIAEAVKNATVDGLITMGLTVDQSISDTLRQRKLPFVTIDGVPSRDIVSINIDDEGAAELEMRTVLEHGHRKIAVLALPDNAYSSSDDACAATITRKRRNGYIAALSKQGMTLDDVQYHSCDATFDDGYQSTQRILEKSRPTCFVCMSDIAAIGSVKAIREKGLRVPEDISVIGFDGISAGFLMETGLTTIEQSAEEKGLKSAETLFMILDGKMPENNNLTIPFRLLERGSLSRI